MIVITVMYPNSEGSRFDLDYYVQKHIPMVQARWSGMGLKGTRVLRGTGEPGGGKATYSVLGVLEFDSLEAFGKAVGVHGKEVMGDIPNFTNVQPVLQFNEVVG